jgi:protein-tyrosine-phosphatase
MKVLFVCSGNAHRSPLAEALLKKLRPNIEVDSAGLHVAIPISQEAKRYLSRKKAATYLKKFPESLDSKHLEEYDVIVAMEQRHKDAVIIRCPECESRIIMWNIRDPYFMSNRNAEKVYQQIEDKVSELANSL